MSRVEQKLREWTAKRTRTFGLGYGMEVGPAEPHYVNRFPVQIKLSDGTDSRDQPHVELLSESDAWDLRDHLLDLILELTYGEEDEKLPMQVGPGGLMDAKYTKRKRKQNCEQYADCRRIDPHGHLTDGGLGEKT